MLSNFLLGNIGLILLPTVLIKALLIINSGSTGNIESDLTEIFSNWDKHPILDIIERKGNCPNTCTLVLQDLWPGTKEGCFCKKGPYQFQDKIYKGECSINMSLIACKRLNPIGNQQLKYYRGVSLCVKFSSKKYSDYDK